MSTADHVLIELEKTFWQALVDEDTDTALGLLHEPALMVSAQGAMKFDHGQYREMAEQGAVVITDFEMSDASVFFPNEDTAIVTYRVRQTMAERDEPESDSVEQRMADSSVWLRLHGEWRCVMHTETELDDDEDDEAD